MTKNINEFLNILIQKTQKGSLRKSRKILMSLQRAENLQDGRVKKIEKNGNFIASISGN